MPSDKFAKAATEGGGAASAAETATPRASAAGTDENSRSPSSTPRPSRKSSPVRKNKASGASAIELPDQQELDRMIAIAAYHLAEKRNFAPGWELENWENARKEVIERIRKGKG